MFRNRVLQVRMIRTPEPQVVENNIHVDQIVRESIAQAAESTKDIVNHVALIGAGYVVLDTIRRVAIILAENR